MPALIGPNNQEISQNQEKAQLLLKTFFPKAEEANLEDIPSNPRNLEREAFSNIEEEEIYRASKKLSNNKALGLD